LVLAARDHFSEFAVLAGLLAAYGLDILNGHLLTFTASRKTGTGPIQYTGRRTRSLPITTEVRRILDVLHVQALSPQGFGKARQEQFQQELEALIGLLAQDRFQEARAQVNRRLTEALSAGPPSRGAMHPIAIRFDNRAAPGWTVMDIETADTPGFLYAFSNALAMRGITLHTAWLRTHNGTVHDRLGVTLRRGAKITGARAQAALRITAVLINQFTHCLRAAPDPAKALAHFDRMLDQVLDRAPAGRLPAYLQERETLDLLARLFGTSDFLWEDFLRSNLDSLLPVLQEFKSGPLVRDRTALVRELRHAVRRARSHDQRKHILNQFKDRELFRIDMRHLADPAARLQPFSHALTDLAEIILAETLRACQQALGQEFGQPRWRSGNTDRPCEFAIFGLGKFGGREMGYASDIELLFVYEGSGHTDGPVSLDVTEYFERLCQAIMGFIEAKQEGIFHLDVRLRPHGRKSLLAASVEEFGTYYSPAGLAAPFERQALIKLRWVAGTRTLGKRVESLRDGFVYGGAPWDIAAALELRRRQGIELVPPGAVDVKHSPGGIIDIEYTAQYLQILHGASHPNVRTPTTLDALTALRRLHVLSLREENRLRLAYLFLRRLIDALRIVRGHARDLVLPPSDSEEFTFLARRMGYQAPRWRTAALRLQKDIEQHMTWTHRFFTSRFKSKP
jgi:glutamate-ammonia-ligase adenylyltransferase